MASTTIGAGTVVSGIRLNAGGTVTNAGTIDGGFSGYGVYLGAAGTITNTGTINSNSDGAIDAQSNLYLNNSGVITGRVQGVFVGGTATITNQASGTIIGHYHGLYLEGTGSVVNAGSIGGSQAGIKLDGAGTIVNSGTISSDGAAGHGGPSGSYAAIIFGSTGSNRLIADPGAVFNGGVWAPGAGSNTLELAAGSGTLTGFDTNFQNFQTINVDAGANWTFTGAESLEVFAASESITVASGASLTYNGSVVCFCAGTHIRTPDDEVAVENLRVSDRVITVMGGPAPIVWIAHRRVNCTRHPTPEQVWPVQVMAHAFGQGLPYRDLFVSPDHAVYVNEVLIPIRHLINGSTIVQVRHEEVTYYHVQLAEHDVLFADGLPTELYLDTGGRSNFENGGGPVRLHPQFSARMWEAEGCAPLIVTGAILAAVRTRLRQRAAELADLANCGDQPNGPTRRRKIPAT